MGTQAISLGANRARNAQRAYWLTLEPHHRRFSHFALDYTRQVTTKTNSNAVNGGTLLPVLVVPIPTSANVLNTCTPLSNRVGLRDHVLATYTLACANRTVTGLHR